MTRVAAFVLVSLFLLVPDPQAAVQSRPSVSGSVVDGALKPLSGVAVALERTGKVVARVTTAADGLFRFASVEPGDYLVRATLAGYPVFTRQLRVPAGSANVQLPIVLATQKANEAVFRQTDEASARSATTVLASPPPPPAMTPPPAAIGVAGGQGRGAVGAGGGGNAMASGTVAAQPYQYRDTLPYYPIESGESYASINPNRFHSTLERPLSTFGADVDTASYTNVRRMLSSGQLPPKDAVRVEEFLNYFRFNYAGPRDGRPIAMTTEIGECPWAPSHKLVLIGARAATSTPREITGRNLVLLIDVSGSMAPPERLPLIKTALGMFVDTLRPTDTLSIVTYAGTSGVALFPTPARNRDTIQRAIAQLNANGSTNGGQGLVTAYRIAREAFIPGGINRVILATDGDFNVGVTSRQELEHLIERERDSGVFLSVFGVGSGNLKDSTMEMLADKGNGNYGYVDSIQEARRLLIRDADATLETVAKDVKFQVEFNPAAVAAWKLIGYENRALAARDFNNDRKDAGDMGAGHTVTVLYEVIPVGADRGDRNDEIDDARPEVDPLRYQPQPPAGGRGRGRAGAPVSSVTPNLNGEWLTVKARYKQPEGDVSQIITLPVRANTAIQHLPFASAVAEFGLLLRDSPHNTARWTSLERRVERLASPGTVASEREGFKELVALAASMARIGRERSFLGRER